VTIETTEWARDILTRAHQAARRFNPDAEIRVTRTAMGVEAILTDAPGASDQRVAVGEVTIFVEAGLAGLLDVEEPHDRLVLRPPGSTPNPRGEH
jgi:hypothetical protein